MGILQLIAWYRFGQNQARHFSIMDMHAHANSPLPPPSQKHTINFIYLDVS